MRNLLFIRHIIPALLVLIAESGIYHTGGICAVPKKNIFKAYYIEKKRLPDEILLYGDWNSLSKEGFGIEYMRRLRRTWAVSFGFERIHNSLRINDRYVWTDIKVDENLNYALDKFGINLDWQIRRKYYGFTVGGGFGVTYLNTRSLQLTKYSDSEPLFIRETEDGKAINLVMDNRVGAEVYLPPILKVSALFVEASLIVNINNLSNDVLISSNSHPDSHSVGEIDYLNNFADGIFLRAGAKFLF